MRKIMSFGIAFAIAATAFAFTMLAAPPVSEARVVPRIDTYELTLQSTGAIENDYDCN